MSQLLQRRKIGALSFLDAGEGAALVLLHGVPGSCLAWEGAVPRLARRFRVIAPDLLGFGESDSPTAGYYMEEQAHAVHALLVALDVDSLYLVGHDFGGPVAITLLRLFPQLHLRGLVLCSTNIFTDTFVPLPLRCARVPILGTAVFKLMAGTWAGMRMIHRQAAADKQALPWARFRRHLSSRSIDCTRRIFQRSLADLVGNYQAVQDHLPNIASPVLVIWGERDPFFAPSVGERTHRALAGSAYRCYRGVGHFAPEEAPERFADDVEAAFFR